MERLYATFSTSPVLGVNPELNVKGSNAEAAIPVFADDVEIERSPIQKDVLAMYYSGGVKSNRQITFDDDLGVAVEIPPPGVTLRDLWEISI